MKLHPLFLFLSLGLSASAAEPMPEPARAGKVLLLDTEQIVEGNIERIGKYYVIKGEGAETRLPVNRAIALVQSRKEAFEVLRNSANLRDPDERLRLARWCVLQGLRDDAVLQARAVLQFDPRNQEADSIVSGLRNERVVPGTTPAPAPTSKPQPLREATPEEFNRESFGLFVTKVQPILMNTCVGCHSGGKGGEFQLLRVTMPGDRKANLYNLSAALKFLDRRQPARSPLLTKSVAAHGGAIAAPLRDQKLQAFENLEAWVSLALAPDGASEGIPLVREEKPTARAWEPAEAANVPKKKGIAFGESSTSKPLPETKTEPADPFDPAIFNEEIKPKK